MSETQSAYAEVTIDTLSPRGLGVFAYEGQRYYLPDALPGERFRVHIYKSDIGSYERLTASPERATPPCPHFGTCGGCQLQHLNDDAQTTFIKNRIASALHQVGLETEINAPLRSPLHSRRRATFTAKRTKKSVIIGFLEERSHRLIDISKCVIVTPRLFALRSFIFEATKLTASRAALVKYKLLDTGTVFDLAIENGKPLAAEDQATLTHLATSNGIARMTYNGELLFQSEPVLTIFGKTPAALPPNSFLQATKDGEITLQHLVQNAIGDAKQIADLFCGAGTFTLAQEGAVHGFDSDKDMIAALQNAIDTAQLHNKTATARDLFRNPLLASELNPFDAIIIDPPRAGAAEQVREIVKSDVNKIVYVSCNPVSFAKDSLAFVNAGFNLGAITPVDQFRFSNHIELVTTFTRK